MAILTANKSDSIFTSDHNCPEVVAEATIINIEDVIQKNYVNRKTGQ